MSRKRSLVVGSKDHRSQMKNYRQSALRIFLVITLFMIVSALAIHPVEAGSDMSKDLDLRAQNNRADLPTNQLIIK